MRHFWDTRKLMCFFFAFFQMPVAYIVGQNAFATHRPGLTCYFWYFKQIIFLKVTLLKSSIAEVNQCVHFSFTETDHCQAINQKWSYKSADNPDWKSRQQVQRKSQQVTWWCNWGLITQITKITNCKPGYLHQDSASHDSRWGEQWGPLCWPQTNAS